MRKLLSLIALGGIALLLSSCATDDEQKANVTPAQLYGTWSLVNDADPTNVTKLTFSQETFINYSATHTTVNPTIPANCPSYTKSILIDPTLDPAYTPWSAATKEYTKEQGYFTILGNKLTFWPQVSRTSSDGTTWAETAAADLASMEEYTFSLNNANVMVLIKGDGTRQTFLK